jgi:hypothetical protein
MMGKK